MAGGGTFSDADRARLKAILDAKGDPDGKLKRVTDFLTKEINEASRSHTRETIKTAMEDEKLIGPMEALNAQFKEFWDRQKEASKSGFSNQMSDLGHTFDAAAESAYKLNSTFGAAQRGLQAFMKESKSFVFMNRTLRNELLDTTIKMEGLGFAQQDLAAIVDSGAMAFGKSGEQLQVLMAQLGKASLDLAMHPVQLSQDFQYAQKTFAYNTDRFMENFLNLETMARKTGVSFRTLASSFGDTMDTFSGSAQMAGRLNQILGKSVFNSIELLDMTEAQRSEEIRKQIQKRFGGNVKNLKKFELKAIASSLKMSVEETRRFLRTGSTAGTDKAMEGLRVSRLKPGDEVDVIKRFVENIESFRRPLEQEKIRFHRSIFELQKGVDYAGRILKAFGIEGLEHLSPSQKFAAATAAPLAPHAGMSAKQFISPTRGGATMGFKTQKGFSRFIEFVAANPKLDPETWEGKVALIKLFYESGSSHMLVADAASGTIVKGVAAGKIGGIGSILGPGSVATLAGGLVLKGILQIMGASHLAGDEKTPGRLEREAKKGGASFLDYLRNDPGAFQIAPETVNLDNLTLNVTLADGTIVSTPSTGLSVTGKTDPAKRRGKRAVVAKPKGKKRDKGK